MFDLPTEGELLDSTLTLYVQTLPPRVCDACHKKIDRRTHRVLIRASWRTGTENLCQECWEVIVQWARRFALQQMELPLA